MADARSLLRAQRAARRIEHPHAQYTDSGKLTCTVCREAIKSDGLWDTHTRSASHRQKFLAHQKAKARPQQRPPPPPPPTNGVAQKSKSSTDTLSDEALLAQIISGSGAGNKRKHGEDADAEMADVAAGEGDGEDDGAGDAVRKKRSRQDIGSPIATAATASIESTGMLSPLNHPASSTTARNGSPMKTDSPPVGTPPSLVRRSSGTPSHGVELQIPSRPATPSASAGSSTSTPKATPIGRSPLIPQEAQMGTHPAAHPRQGPRANFVTSFPSAAATATTEIPHSNNSAIATATIAGAKSSTTAAAGGAEDDDWAAFEAEVVHAAAPTTATTNPLGSSTTPGTATRTTDYANSDAVISAAPLTAEQLAAKSEEEERAKRRAAADIELEDEQEEAKRAMEAEFEEMEELEARVRKLKEKREAIRRGSVPATTTITTDTMTAPAQDVTVNGTTRAADDNNNKGSTKEQDDGSDDDEEEEEEEEDDWAGFRFRG